VVVSFDVFKMGKEGPVWRGSANTLDDAKARVQKLGKIQPGEYLIINQRTGERLEITTGTANSEE
jgi:hypothetical protein